MSVWKKCSDLLPEANERVLCYSPNGGQFVGYHTEDKCKGHNQVFFRIPGAGKGKLATHWMPCPDNPVN